MKELERVPATREKNFQLEALQVQWLGQIPGVRRFLATLVPGSDRTRLVKVLVRDS